MTVLITIKECGSVTANGHELVFGDRNCETGYLEFCCGFSPMRTICVIVTVFSLKHQDFNLALDGYVCNLHVSRQWLGLTGRVATIDKKISSFMRKQPSVVPKGYGILTSPHLSVQLGRANGNAVAVAAAAINDNITPTQVGCTSILCKPIALLSLRRVFSVVCGELHRCSRTF